MNITRDEVREAIRKDNFDYMNQQIDAAMDAAKAAFMESTGFKTGDKLPDRSAAEFESLSNRYIVEYVRGAINEVDNERTLTVLALQCENLLIAESPDGGGNG